MKVCTGFMWLIVRYGSGFCKQGKEVSLFFHRACCYHTLFKTQLMHYACRVKQQTQTF